MILVADVAARSGEIDVDINTGQLMNLMMVSALVASHLFSAVKTIVSG